MIETFSMFIEIGFKMTLEDVAVEAMFGMSVVV